jgi:hypothetical protein
MIFRAAQVQGEKSGNTKENKVVSAIKIRYIEWEKMYEM